MNNNYALMNRLQAETEKRWLSWSMWTARGAKHSYAGTVPENIKAKRRAANKAARKQRRVNRVRGS